ncbi:MAG TPA: hypothetical protein VLW06_15830 [Terriglobales bacterium]|nr:hypothetical protein [Terriglobales bacterium]
MPRANIEVQDAFGLILFTPHVMHADVRSLCRPPLADDFGMTSADDFGMTSAYDFGMTSIDGWGNWWSET